MLLSIINLHHNLNQDFKDELVKESVTALPAVPVCLHNQSADKHRFKINSPNELTTLHMHRKCAVSDRLHT